MCRPLLYFYTVVIDVQNDEVKRVQKE